jgi:hypothetical protein
LAFYGVTLLSKIPFLKLKSFFSDPFTVTIKGCKLSYILPFFCEIKNDFGQKPKNICQKKNFKEFSKEKLLKSFVILELFVFS